MAKNEAKIKFTAETGGFNDAIKKANSELSELRAELKLNETQMKSTGDTVEGLENKHKILSEQLVVASEKSETMSQKLSKAVEMFGENSTEASKLRTQLLNAQIAEEKLRQAVEQCEDQLSEQIEAANKVETATEKLTNTIKEQQGELDQLKSDYQDAVLEYGEASDKAKGLEGAIGDLSRELKENKDKLSDAADKADKLDLSLENAEDAAESSEGGFTILKATIAELAADAIKSAVSALGDFISYLGELPEETREFRQDMATLNTSFENVGMSSETAKETWQDLYTVFGEDDRAVETANNIARMAENQEDLNDWVTITTGVWGTYQDSLPVEGLAEAAGETAKTGAVTGVLADALNWSSEAAQMFAGYMNDEVVTAEDAFNVALSECTTEQERQQLITDTLTSLYGDAAETYRDASGAQLEAKDATAENILAEAALADAIEPVTTKFTELKTALLEWVLPAVETVSGAIVGAIEWFQGLPETLSDIKDGAAETFSKLKDEVVDKAEEIKTNTSEKWEEMKKNTTDKMENWKNEASTKLSELKEGFSEKTADIKTNWATAFTGVRDTATNLMETAKNNASTKLNNMKNAYSNAGGGIRGIVAASFTAVRDNIGSTMSTANTLTGGKLDEIRNNFSNKLSNARSTVSTVMGDIKEAFSSKMSTAKEKVTGAISKIKNAFNFSWKLPDLKLPHISVTGGKAPFGIGGKGSLPKFSINWYAKGGLFTGPTILPANGFGEADPEYALPLNETTLTPLANLLGDLITDKINSTPFAFPEIDYDKLANAMAQQKISVVYGKREFGRVVREVM